MHSKAQRNPWRGTYAVQQLNRYGRAAATRRPSPQVPLACTLDAGRRATLPVRAMCGGNMLP